MKHDGDSEFLSAAIERKEPIVVRVEVLVRRVEFEPSASVISDTLIQFCHGVECHIGVDTGKRDEAFAPFTKIADPLVRANPGHHGVILRQGDGIVDSLVVQEMEDRLG